MAERLAYLEAVIGADITQFRKGMRDIRNETGVLSEVTRGVAGFGRTLTFAYTTPLLVLGGTALQTASEFESAMRNINSIAGLSENALADLSARTLEFGKTTRSGAIESANALYTVFSAGIMDVDDAFALMNTSVKTSEAGLSDLTTTTNALVSILLSYGDTTEAMSNRASDALTRMVQVGVGSMDAFASAIGGVMPSASAAGMSIEDLFGDMAFLTQRGLSAAQAGISMNAVLKKLISPTEAMSAAFAELGGDNLPELIDQFGSVNNVIEELIRNADGDLTQLFAMFNTTQGQRAISQFAGNMEQWETAQDDFNSGMQGATASAWEQQMKSFAASWDLLKSAVQGAGIAIGQTMFPILQPIIDKLAEFINGVSSANPKLIGMATAFVAVTAVIPPLLWLLGSLISPIGLIVGAVAALGVAFHDNFGGIRDVVTTTINGIKDDVQPLLTAFDAVWDAIFPEDIEEAVTGGAEPVEIDPYDYITVTEPKSLWQIYEEEGYADQFSWQEFMDEAFAGGWQGGAVTPDTPIRIRPRAEIETAEIQAMAQETLSHLPQPEVPEGFISEPLETSITNALPALKTAVVNLLSELVPSASETAGWVSGKIASLLFDGVTGAISYIFSGQAANDAGTLATDITTWLSDNVVTPFSDGMSTALEGTELQTAIDGVTTFIDDIKNAFNINNTDIDFSGFQDLIDGVSSAVSSLTNADWSGVAKLGIIIGIIGGAAFGIAMDVLNGIGSGLGLIITDLGDGLANIVDALALAGNGDLEGGLTKLGQALIDFGFAILQVPAGIIDTLVGAILGLFNLDVPSIGDWLENLKNDIQTGIDNWLAGGDEPIQLTLADLVNVDLTGNEGMIQENMETLAGMLDTSLQDLWASDTTTANAMPLNFEWDADATNAMQILNGIIANPDEIPAAREVAATIRQTIIDDLTEHGIEIPPQALRLPDGSILPLEYVTLPDGTVVTLPNPEFTVTGQGTIGGQPLTIPNATTNPEATPSDMEATGMVNFVPTGATITTDGGAPITTDTPLTVQPSQPVDLTGVSLSFGEEIVSGESAQSIIDANFIPIETAWVAMYSPEGLMATTFATFQTDVTTGWSNISQGVNNFNETMGEVLPNITSLMTTEAPAWSSELDPFIAKVQAAKEAVNSLMSTIKQLMSMQGSFSIDVNFTGNVEGKDGSHAGGLDYVPFDGYIAELHKGERVLTAKEATQMDEGENYRSNVVVPQMPTGSDNGQVVNNFNGIQNVDAILFELRRRGYKLEKR